MKQNRILNNAIPWIVVSSLLLATGCMPTPPADDNSEITFVKEMVPKILGRRAAGADEVELLADISTLHGREMAIRTLMEQPEFVDHWTDVLVDHLQMQRDGSRVQFQGCFGDPLRVDGSGNPTSDSGALALFVRDNPATSVAPGAGANPFNMIDLIRSAIELDDLSPVYRAYAFPLNARPGFFANAEQRQQNVGRPFNHIFLNHSIGCLGCHNSQFSTTNSMEWKRTHAMPLALEDAVYDSAFGAFESENYGFFRGSGGGTAWGIVNICGQLNSSVGAPVATRFAGLNGNNISMLDVDAQFLAGYVSTKTSGVTRIANSPNLPDVSGSEGYAFMVAATIAQNVWRELVGEPLTIANYYARNAAQMQAHWNLTEFNMIPSSWSLKDLIIRIVKTRFINRRPPVDSAGCTPPGGGSANTPYCLQMLFDPWVERDPRIPDADLDDPDDPKISRNGQGELVHRYSPRSLLNSVARALGWTAPQRYPSETDYPKEALVTGIGQYRSAARQGTRAVDFQGLLTWEDQFGTCQKPAGISSDWIDEFVGSISAFDSANPGAPLTVQDAIITMKDWLIQEQNINAVIPVDVSTGMTNIGAGSSEQSALADHFGVTLNTTLSTVPDLQSKLRAYCGVLLQSPDFMLAHIKEDRALTLPRQRVCLPGEPCSYSEYCDIYADTLTDLGAPTVCLNRAVVHGLTYVDPSRWMERLCPGGNCGFVRLPGIEQCLDNPLDCRMRELPPRCDPRWCDPSPIDFSKTQVMIVDAHTAEVNRAEGVNILRRGDTKFDVLKGGMQLKAGDILRAPAGSHLIIGDGKILATPREGMVAPLDLRTTKLDRALSNAVDAGGLEQVVKLIKGQGADVDALDAFGRTPLTIAVDNGDEAMVKTLMELGANLNIADNRGLRPVELAAAQGNDFIQKLLLYSGVSTNPDRLKMASKRDNKLEPKAGEWVMLVAAPADREFKPADDGEFMSAQEAFMLNRAGKLETRFLDIRVIQKQWKETGFHHRGQAGPLPSREQAKKDLAFYTENFFQAEHRTEPPDSKGEAYTEGKETASD